MKLVEVDTPMVKCGKQVALASWLLASVVGCTSDDRNWKETIPVTGTIFVDGAAAEGVMLTFHPAGGMDKTQPTETTAMTDSEGQFKASTYEVGDGAPVGEYTVTFEWPKLNAVSMRFEGDKFKGKYAKLEKSTYRITVESGKPVDMGRLDL
ncbi:MAG: hypothetical protein KDB22_03950 [Planctomycetales bacterium]|nr:hypothetical protein [Planctomycetales bacterium]